MLNRTMKVEKVKVEGVGDRRDEDNFKGDFDVEAQICIRDPPKSYPSRKDLNCSNQEDHLESSEVLKIGEVREENERLKEFLARSMTESQPTEMHYFEIDKKEEVKEPVEPAVYSDAEESELVSLRLGTSESRLRKEEKAKKIYSKLEEGLSLGLQGRIVEGPTSRQGKPLLDLDADNSFEEPKDEKTGDQPWPPRNKTQTHAAPKEDDQVSPQPTVKRARVSVRARCDAPTMSDGCQWRKYGQKIAKGNPCPRAYYRCTVAPGCPVRKQVQRCAEDMSILITTYEGTHNHALPISATAMASTTSAAASMLMSGSSISQPAAMGYSTSFSTSSVLANIHGANISMSNNSIYSSNSHPTITLDLTSPSSAPQVKFSPNLSLTSRYSSSFNLSTSESNKIPTSWSNGYLSYGAQPHTKSDIISSMAPPPSLGIWQPQDNFNLSFLPNKMINSAPSLPSQQHSLTHMIAGAITSHPRFQSAVAAALTSYVGGAQAGREGSSSNLQQEQLASPPTHAAVATRNDCTPRYLTISNSPNLNQRQ